MPKVKKTKKTKKKKAKKKVSKPAKKKKKVTKKKAKKKKVKKRKPKKRKYYEAVGRRKTATAIVRLFTKGKKEFLVNGKPVDEYFSTLEMRQIAKSSLKKMKSLDRFRVTVRVKGSGLHAQAEAIRHGTARALVKFNSDYKKRLKRVNFLTRDPRMRERKKPGLKRARRAPQWQKR